MCEHVKDRRHYVGVPYNVWVENTRQRVQGMEFSCKYHCAECRDALKARLVGDVWAQRATSDRNLFVTLTLSDEQLLAFEGSTAAAADIDAAKPLFAPFMERLRKMLRRLHPDIEFEVAAHRSAEHGDENGRVHFHAILSFRIEWVDPERRKSEMRPEWSDGLIPNFYLNWRYIHEWESADDIRRRGGRVSRAKYPANVPWPFGFVRYENIRSGGVADYVAGYATKAIDKSLELKDKRAKGEACTPEDYAELDRLWKSMKSTRRSLRYGHRFYRERGAELARQGLPPSTTFTVPAGAKAIPGYDPWAVEGSDYRLKSKASCDDFGTMWLRQKVVPEKSPDYLIYGSAARAYIDGFDSEWARLHGDRKAPVASTIRHLVIEMAPKTIDRQYYGFGIDEARLQKQKYEWRLEDTRFLRRRDREMATVAHRNPQAVIYRTVHEELRTTPSGSPPVERPDRSPLAEAWRSKFRREHLNKNGLTRWDRFLDRAYQAVVDGMEREAFEQKFGLFARFEQHWKKQTADDMIAGIWRLGRSGDMAFELRWLRDQPALAGWSAGAVWDLWMDSLGPAVPPWRWWPKANYGKPDSLKDYQVLASGKA